MSNVIKYKSLIDKIITLQKYSKQHKFENACTNIYILNMNFDDDKLLEQSIKDKKISYNNYNPETEILNTGPRQTGNIEQSGCCKFKCCKLMNN